ncbi:MAG: hypothetical protein GY806_14045 [Gammaproteobacteria bacterium]|nr:hypothetical protein [Gammaproteobacteria bacterium]
MPTLAFNGFPTISVQSLFVSIVSIRQYFWIGSRSKILIVRVSAGRAGDKDKLVNVSFWEIAPGFHHHENSGNAGFIVDPVAQGY